MVVVKIDSRQLYLKRQLGSQTDEIDSVVQWLTVNAIRQAVNVLQCFSGYSTSSSMHFQHREEYSLQAYNLNHTPLHYRVGQKKFPNFFL